MSWLFGLTGKTLTQDDIESARKIHGDPLQSFTNEKNYYIATGGNTKTCFTSQDDVTKANFWVGLGCVFQCTFPGNRIFTQNEWEVVSRDIDLLDNSDGHYVFLLFKQNCFEIRTDKLGLRTFFWSKKGDNIIFSTRIDWITKFLNGCQIDYKQVGSRWLIFNQLSCASLVNTIYRLGPGGKLTISDKNVLCSEQPFQPDFSKIYSYNETVEILENYLSLKLNENLKITFGLSGGLDSRVLLSLLLKSRNNNFRTHTFGNIQEPDVLIPEMMGKKEKFLSVSYNNPLPSAHELIPLLNDYISETNLIEPISTVLRLRNYTELDATKFILIDGGFGEIARRQYLNRLAIRGKKPIIDRNVDIVLTNLRNKRANIFTPEIINRMELGVRSEIEYMFNTMPNVKEIGLENYLDLWAIRTRFPNFGADEQARLDSFILNFMPFAQKSFVNMVFSMPVELRTNGKFFRNLINNSYPSLTKYPLVKNNITYPFYLSTKTAWLYTKIKSKLGYSYSENHIHTFLEMLRDFVFDLLLSKNTKEYSAYNYQAIITSVENYYSGNKAFSNEVNWWLTFELWRRNIEIK